MEKSMTEKTEAMPGNDDLESGEVFARLARIEDDVRDKAERLAALDEHLARNAAETEAMAGEQRGSMIARALQAAMAQMPNERRDPITDQCSETIAELATALCKAQSEFDSASKGGRVEGNRKSYSYVTMADMVEATRPALTANGLAVLQPTRASYKDGTRAIVRTILIHSSGEFIASELVSPPIHEEYMNEHQALGSAQTYLKKYGYSSLVGLPNAAEDDDGQAAAPTGSAPRGDKWAEYCNADGELIAAPFGKARGTSWDALSPRELEWYATRDEPIVVAAAEAELARRAGSQDPEVVPATRENYRDADGKLVAIPTGKNKGAVIADLSDPQLAWYATNSKDDELREACKAEVQRRAGL